MRHATLRQLQVFTEAARILSFARAAEKLHLTPAAVSFQIRHLETLSGFALFERIGKKVALTEAGRLLAPYAEIVLKALSDADQGLSGLKGLGGGRVTLGLVSTAKYIAPHIMAAFQKLYPGVAARLVDGNRAEIVAALLKGELDLAMMGQPPEGADITALAFADHPTLLIAAPGHRLAGARRLPLSALAAEQFIVREEGSGTAALLARHFAKAGFKPRVAMMSSSNETIKQAVMAGMGAAFISGHTVSFEVAQKLLIILPVSGFPLMRRWYIAHRASMPLLPLHARLKAFFAAEGADAIARLAGAAAERAVSGPDN